MHRPDYDVIVIGAGMTGLTASKRLVERGVRVANIEGSLFGGLITNVNELEGEYEGSGADLASTLMMEIGELGCDTLSETVTGIHSDDYGVTVATDASILRGRSAIVASGAKLKRLGVPGEAALEYKGVSQCADCDGPMFKGQDVVVVGGGDSALQEALVLSRYCTQVHLVYPELRARRHWIEALSACSNVQMRPQSEVIAIEGTDRVEAVRVRGDREDLSIPCAGVFAYIGLAPSTAFLPTSVQRDANGALVTTDSLETTLRNVFAAGAVRSGFGGTLADAVRDATLACDSILANVQ